MLVFLQIALCVGVGVLVALQAVANARLAQALGQPLWAAAIAITVCALAIYATLMLARSPLPTRAEVAGVTWWAWAGGLGGAAFIISLGFLIPRVGVATFLVATIAGQLVASIILKHRGWLGLVPTAIDVRHIGGLVLVLVGATLLTAGDSATHIGDGEAVPDVTPRQLDE